MRVIGLDLSLTCTGVSTPDSDYTITSKLSGVERLSDVREAVVTVTDMADLVVIEGYSMGSSGAHSHALGELGGVVRLALHEAEVPFVEVPPSSLKLYATGKGNAAKTDVFAAAIRRAEYAGSSLDETDALWLRLMAHDHYDLAERVGVPDRHRKALFAIAWPDMARIQSMFLSRSGVSR